MPRRAQGQVGPSAPAPASKVDDLTRAARAIIDAEQAAREAKTARLREARLAQKAAQRDPVPPANSNARPKKTARTVRGRSAA